MPTSTSRLPVRPHWLLLGVAVLAAAIVAIAASASSNSSPSGATSARSAPAVSGAAATRFQGIPERNGVLGASTAKITLTEFVDPQCPICAAAARQDLPTLVSDYVRTGKIRLRARVLQFIGPDSVTAARFAAGAAQQQRLWPFLATLYSAQGQENSGYMTPAFLRGVSKASGVDAAQASAYASTAAAGQTLNIANDEAKALGVDATPTFVAQRGNGTPRVLASGLLEPAQLKAALDKVLAQ